MSNIQKCELTFDMKEWEIVSPEAIDLIKNILVKDPKKRYSAKEVLEHSWFKLEFRLNQPKLDHEIMQRLKNFHA